MTPLTRDLVRQYFSEEATRANAAFDDVIGSSHAVNAVTARRRAVQRIVKYTGCSAHRLSIIWGADHTAVTRCLTEPSGIAPYTTAAIERLTWAHGAERAQAIVEGRDPATEADLQSWRNIGRRAA